MDTKSGQILIVEDEVNIRAGLRDILIKDGYRVKDVGCGEEALASLVSTVCEVAIVDIQMPGMTGIELLQLIRARWQHVAVIILTGHGGLESAIAAVKAGAHDYLIKPAKPDAIRQTVIEAMAVSRRRQEQAHLLESLRTGLNRLDGLTTEPISEIQPSTDVGSLQIGGLHIDLRSHEVHRDDQPIHLSPTEFKLLVTLTSRPGEVFDYTTLARLSLGYESEPWEAKELLKRHVFAMRHKIEPDPASPRYLLNVRGVGYRLASAT